MKDGDIYTLMVTSAVASDNTDFTVRISKTDETDLGKITVKIGEEEQEVVEEVPEKVIKIMFIWRPICKNVAFGYFCFFDNVALE